MYDMQIASYYANLCFFMVKFTIYVIIQHIKYEVKELSNPGPLYTEPKADAEEEEMPEDEQRRSKFPTDIAEDNPVVGQPRSKEGRAACH